MKYENGFYIYTPNEKCVIGYFSYIRIIEIEFNDVLLTGIKGKYSVDEIELYGTIGKMVMNDKGEVL